MKKPDALRAHLVKWVPVLGQNPDRLQLFVEAGRIAARAGCSLSFEYRYTLNILVTDFAGDRNSLVVPLLLWIGCYQPELLRGPSFEPFTFEAEILESDAADISFRLALSELVRVTPLDGGGFEATELDEPDTRDHFPDVCGAKLWQLYLGEDLIDQSTSPDFVATQS